MADDLVLAVDIGGTHTKAEVLNRAASPVASLSARTPRGEPHVVQAVVDLGARLRSEVAELGYEPPIGAGIAAPGIVDTEAGVVRNAVNLGLRDVPIARAVQTRLGLPVVLSHDVAAGGNAEWRMGAGRGVDDLMIVIIGTGIAAVIVAGGRLIDGGLAQGGELGHVVVRPGAEHCACGQSGCVESFASAASIARAYTKGTGRPVEGAADVRAMLGQDPSADAVWSQAMRVLSDGLLAACALFAPARIVFGGGLAAAGDCLLDPLREQMAKTWRVPPVPELVTAKLGGRAGVVGAGLAMWDALERR